MSVSDGPVGRRSRVWTVVAGRCSWLLVVVVAVFSVLAVGVTGASAARAKPALRIGETFSGYEFWHDPAAFGAYGREINLEFSTAYAALFHQAPNGQIQPEIATSWQYFATHTGKNKGFEFTIRHNVRFADGSLLTAQSIVGWFNHMYAQHTQASVGYSETFGPNPKFEAVGKWKVKMILSQPNPDVAVTLSDGGPLWGFIASPKCVADPTLFNTQTCGAGPYMLEASGTVAGSHYTYVPNPHYYDKSAIHFSSVTFTVIPSATTMFQALESGQLDLAAQGNTATTVAAAKSAGFAVHTARIARCFVVSARGREGRHRRWRTSRFVRRSTTRSIARRSLRRSGLVTRSRGASSRTTMRPRRSTRTTTPTLRARQSRCSPRRGTRMGLRCRPTRLGRSSCTFR